MNGEEHLQWCKDRAIKYVNRGELPQAYASMASDMRKHEDTKDHIAIQLGVQLLVAGQLNTASAMEDFINGFN